MLADTRLPSPLPSPCLAERAAAPMPAATRDRLQTGVALLRERLGRVGAHFDIGPRRADGTPEYDYNFVWGKMAAMHGQVFRGHIGGDKFSARAPSNRSEFYAHHLARWATAARFTILEIGVFRGESLATWEGVFCNANVIGVDGNLRPFNAHLNTLRKLGAFRTKMPQLLEGDSMNASGPLSRVLDGSIDVIIDDGCHLPSCQVSTCRYHTSPAHGQPKCPAVCGTQACTNCWMLMLQHTHRIPGRGYKSFDVEGCTSSRM